MSTPAIRTKFTDLVGATIPLVQPPMAYSSGGALAAQVTLAGGFGFIGFALDPIEKLRRELDIARTQLNLGPQDTLPIGVGFVGWLLDIPALLPAKELFELLYEYHVKAVWLSFGDNTGTWIERIRELNQQHDHHILVFTPVYNLKEAQTAINTWKADVVVAQGIEAGGHGHGSGIPLVSLLSVILSHAPPDGPPILGAGGIPNGSQIAALLTLGASGVVIGTRFLLSTESLSSDSQRKAIINADSEQTVRTMAFDEARNTMGWPKGINGRALRNATSEEYERGEDIGAIRAKYQEADKKDDVDRIVTWAGIGVGLMDRVSPTSEIVKELLEETLRRLSEARNLVTA